MNLPHLVMVFKLFFRGNRANLAAKLTSKQPAENVIVTYEGPINNGDIGPIPIGYTDNGNYYDGYFLAGNPYPAPLDWNKIYSSSLNLSPNITFVEGVEIGAYVSYNAMEGANVNGNNNSGFIKVGQAFYVNTDNGPGTLNFNESHKATEEVSPLILNYPTLDAGPQARMANAPANKKMDVIRSKDNLDILKTNVPSVSKGIKMTLYSDSFKEETKVFFNSKYDAIANIQDSKYFLGYNISLATLSEDKKSLAINLMPDINDVDSLRIEVNSLKETKFRLQFNEIASISDRAIHLKDNYLDTLISIKHDEDAYDFTIDKKIAETYGKSRFVLLFAKPIPPVKEPANFQAKKEDNKSLLTWTSGLNIYGGKFEVERSSDSKVFNKIADVNLNVDNDDISFSYIDQFPLNGNNYYRIKQIDAVASIIYSSILKLSYETLDPQEDEVDLKIYPNPVKEFLTIDYKSEGEQTLTLSIYNLQGQRLKRLRFLSGEPIRFSLLDLKEGVYVMELKTLKDNKVIVSRKLIKE